MASENRRKVTVQVWEPLYLKLSREMAQACLNRDAYLDRVLADEARYLSLETRGHRNSDAAKAFAKKSLFGLKEFRPVSLSLSGSTIDAIDAACAAVNCWRDVFVNRVLFLLLGKSDAVEAQLDLRVHDHHEQVLEQCFDVKGLLFGTRIDAVRRFILDSPFQALRIALEAEFPDTKGRLHLQSFGDARSEDPIQQGLVGLSVYLDDSRVPSTAAGKAHAEMFAKLFDDIEEMATKKRVQNATR